MRQNLQERVEKIHSDWHYTDEYLVAPTAGTLVGLDPGLIVSPPSGMEIGYVPIVTRQEKDTTVTSITSIEYLSNVKVYPNPTKGFIQIETKNNPISSVQLFSVQGKLLNSQDGLNSNSLILQIDNYPVGLYFLNVIDHNGMSSKHRIIKSN